VKEKDLSVTWSAEGTVSISGPAFDPRGWKGSAQLVNFELRPKEQGAARTERYVLSQRGPSRSPMDLSVVTWRAITSLDR